MDGTKFTEGFENVYGSYACFTADHFRESIYGGIFKVMLDAQNINELKEYINVKKNGDNIFWNSSPISSQS